MHASCYLCVERMEPAVGAASAPTDNQVVVLDEACVDRLRAIRVCEVSSKERTTGGHMGETLTGKKCQIHHTITLYSFFSFQITSLFHGSLMAQVNLL